jgi:DNA segregation ATPase FtsK/SpoIIIE, S-DNA-T family
LSLNIGIEDFSLRPLVLELNASTPHALIGGGMGSGRTGALHTFLFMLAATEANKHARVILVDFRHTSRLLRRLPNMWMYADTEERLIEAVKALKGELRERQVRLRQELEQQDDTADELPASTFSPIVLAIDDYDQFSALIKNPLDELRDIMLQARDLGLHIVIAGTPGDFAKSDLLIRQVRACRMGIVLGSDPSESPVLGVRMSDLPPGRGYLVRGKQRTLFQVAHLAPETILPWVKRLCEV